MLVVDVDQVTGVTCGWKRTLAVVKDWPSTWEGGGEGRRFDERKRVVGGQRRIVVRVSVPNRT